MHESYKINRTIPDTIERWASVITLNSFQTWNDNLQIKVSHLLTRPGPKIDQNCLQFLIWFSGRNSLWSGKWALSLTGPYTSTWDIAETTNSSSSERMVCNCEHTHEKRHVFYDDVCILDWVLRTYRHHCRFKDQHKIEIYTVNSASQLLWFCNLGNLKWQSLWFTLAVRIRQSLDSDPTVKPVCSGKCSQS
jgi:hypothetical protein